MAPRLGTRDTPARLAAVFAFLLGIAALTGWALDVPTLTTVLPGAVSMKSNS
jgi:hypothetical protein